MENQKKENLLENFMRNKQDSILSLFSRSNSLKKSSSPISPKPIPLLSPLANSIVSRCSQVLEIPTEELQRRFEEEVTDDLKELTAYARNFLEYCYFQMLNSLTRRSDYLNDKDFRRLTFDMMLAWESPGVEHGQDNDAASCTSGEAEDGDGWSLFYSNSTNMAVQVDDRKTVGPEAFARIAPACAAIADIITVHNLFDALTSTSSHRLHFLIYDKYLRNLHKVFKAAKSASGQSSITNLQLTEGEFVLEVEGTVPTQPVLQHIGISGWPGRLTLTNYALYFESGVGLYDKAVRYDLAMDLKQVIKPELTGPLGARLYDKAVMYKSISVTEPIYLEFPEFSGNSRRDYWLDICLEILRAHRFIRKYDLKGIQHAEALGRASLGILRCRAVREAFDIFSSNYKTLLAFDLAESLPGGDVIVETLSRRLELISDSISESDASRNSHIKGLPTVFPVSVLALSQLGFPIYKEANIGGEFISSVGDVHVGSTSPLQVAVKQSLCNTGKAEAAQATIEQVKVEGIDTNVAVMTELLFPVIQLANSLQQLASWNDSFKSMVFLVLACYATHRGWMRFLLPSIFICLAAFMLWHRNFNKGKPLEAFRVKAPPNKNAVERLLVLQDAINQFEAVIQEGNIVLLKIRALLFAVLPQATEKVAVFLVFMATMFAFLPVRYIILLVFLEAFTREMPLRKYSSDRWLRRVREWWVRIPAAPVDLVKPEDDKKKK